MHIPLSPFSLLPSPSSNCVQQRWPRQPECLLHCLPAPTTPRAAAPRSALTGRCSTRSLRRRLAGGAPLSRSPSVLSAGACSGNSISTGGSSSGIKQQQRRSAGVPIQQQNRAFACPSRLSRERNRESRAGGSGGSGVSSHVLWILSSSSMISVKEGRSLGSPDQHLLSRSWMSARVLFEKSGRLLCMVAATAASTPPRPSKGTWYSNIWYAIIAKAYTSTLLLYVSWRNTSGAM
mmetsp:Transcript_595/g.1909  ORF Transcript_595/g.1909 Transcript_595/m.1909 type:complete len:235 (+) Transcript_595:571-1275(+)